MTNLRSRSKHENLIHLQKIIAAAYQIAGAYGAPERVLDVLADPLGAANTQVDALLPFAVPRPVQPADSTPKLHIGESSFEDWYQAYARQGISKQVARDAYAAGMGDPLVTYAQPVPATQAHSTPPLMQQAFRTTRSGNGKYEMVFAFRDIDTMHAADDEWRASIAQPAAKLLTPSQIAVLIKDVIDTDDASLILFARAVEAAHGIGEPL